MSATDMFRTLSMARQGMQMYGGRFQDHSENFANLGAVAGKERETFLSSYQSLSPYREGGMIEGKTLHRVSTPGTPVASEVKTHLTIGGDGFFTVLAGSDPSIAFTRIGTFDLDSQHKMVNHLGHQLMVSPYDGNAPSGSSLIPLSLKGVSSPAQATTNINLKGSLSIDGKNPQKTIISVHDSYGKTHPLTMEWTQINPNRYVFKVIPSDGVSVPSGNLFGSGVTLEFAQDGSLTNISPGSNSLTLELNGQIQSVQMNFGTLGQKDGLSLSSSFRVEGQGDGCKAGDFESICFDDQGVGLVTYTNGIQKPYCRLPLAVFPNSNELKAVNTGLYMPHIQNGSNGDRGFGSGTATYQFPQQGSAGKIVSCSYEASNINATKVYINMIEDERRYANSLSVMKTAQQMTDQLNQLI